MLCRPMSLAALAGALTLALAPAPNARAELVTELVSIRDVGLGSITAPAIHDDGSVATSWSAIGEHARVRVTNDGGETTETELTGYQTIDDMSFTPSGSVAGTGARTDAPPTTDALLITPGAGFAITEPGGQSGDGFAGTLVSDLPSGWLGAEVVATNGAGFGVGGALAFDASFALVDVPFLSTPQGELIELQRLLPESSDWSLRTATGINNANQIVGQGTLGGVETTYVLTFDQHSPSPGGVVLLGLAAIAAMGRRRP
ncbi:MAG: hypothetical protein AAGI30_13020 [Planctomycetota bacterium]